MKENKPVRPKRRKRRKYTLIRWNPPEERPEEDSFVLMQLVNTVGVYMEYGSYERGRFIFHYFNGAELIIAEESVLGWSYLPYWLFEEP